MTPEHGTTGRDFDNVVNMTPAALAKWLETDESQAVGQKAEAGDESVGHESGRHIVRMLKTACADWTEADWSHAAKVVGYVRRHLAQRPGEAAGSRWEASLKNWGHQP